MSMQGPGSPASTSELGRALEDDLGRVLPPPGDLDRVRWEGQRIRRRRRTGVVVAAVAALTAVTVAGVLLTGGASAPPSHEIDPVGSLDFSEGLRAYADPGREIHLGGRSFPADRLRFLDTDAAATPYGVVFYDAGVPRLLEESGRVRDLEPDAEHGQVHTTAKMDSRDPLVAFGAMLDKAPTVIVRDLEDDRVVARHRVDDDTVVDAVDEGVVFLRDDAGTTTWDSATGELHDFAGPETRVADVRNGVVLYDGPRPEGASSGDYRLVAGAVDAQLTFDGRHVLSWSSVLRPTTSGGTPVRLEQGPVKGLGFWAIDTDGTVLVATLTGKYPNYTVFDCEVPSGRCDRVGPLHTTGGDPLFIGVDL